MYFLNKVLFLADYDCLVGVSSIAIQNLKSEYLRVVIIISKKRILVLTVLMTMFIKCGF